MGTIHIELESLDEAFRYCRDNNLSFESFSTDEGGDPNKYFLTAYTRSIDISDEPPEPLESNKLNKDCNKAVQNTQQDTYILSTTQYKDGEALNSKMYYGNKHQKFKRDQAKRFDKHTAEQKLIYINIHSIYLWKIEKL